MNEREIYMRLVELMEEMLKNEEIQLSYIKMINQKIDLVWSAIPALIGLSLLPDSPEKDDAAELLRRGYEDPRLQEETLMTIAQHESLHERRGAVLAHLKKRLEDL